MFVLLALLIMHGNAALMQFPMPGYRLAFPTLLVVIGRILRAARSFHRIPARLKILDDDTVAITARFLIGYGPAK